MLDSFGDTLWSKIFIAPNAGSINQVISTTDGNYIVRGNLFTSYGIIAKLDNLGDTLWTIDTLYGSDIANTIDGNYILFNINRRLVKISTNGAILWDKGYNFGGIERKVITLSDGSYLAMGGYNGTILLKVNANGDSLWSNVITDSGNPIPLDIIQTSDGGFMVAGVVSGGLFDSDIYLLKLDQNGDKEWSASLFRMGYDETVRSIAQHNDGGYVIFGWGENGSIGGDDWLFVKTDSMGVIVGLWEETPETSMQYKVYPSPATDKVQFSSKHVFTGTLALYDMAGKELWQVELEKSTGWVIPVMGLQTGIYALEILDEDLKTRQSITIIKL